MIPIGTVPVSTFTMDSLSIRGNEGLLCLMPYYCVLHMTYLTCISTLLSVLQKEVLQDSIQEQDLTPDYKRAIPVEYYWYYLLNVEVVSFLDVELSNCIAS